MYKISMKLVLISVFLISSASLFASSWGADKTKSSFVSQETVNIKGIVKDSEGETIIGATVLIKGTTTGVATGFDGDYSLKVPVGATIEVSFIGYETSNFVIVAGQTTYDLVLKSVSFIGEEVVVTGYGGRQLRSEVTTSISSVDSDVFKKGFYENPATALSGLVPGLTVVTASANPRSAPDIILRGGTNWDGSGTPLYIIDGQVRPNMHYINTEDIATMEVLKDAGSTAIYGARANNGVILITTKRGTTGNATINVAARATIKYHNPGYDFVGAEDYLYWMRMAWKNTSQVYQNSHGEWKGFGDINVLNAAKAYGTGNKYFGNDGKPLDGNKSALGMWSPMNYTPELAFLLDEGWQLMKDPVFGGDIIFKEFIMAETSVETPVLSQNYSVNMSGGNEKGQYYASFAYLNDKGIIPDNYFNRINFTFNGDYQINPWLKSISGFKFSTSDENGLPATQSSEGNYFLRMASIPATMRQYNPAGELILGPSSGDGNQLVNIDQFERETNELDFDISQAFKINLYDGLSMQVNANWLYNIDTREEFNKDYQQGVNNINRTRRSKASNEKIYTHLYNTHINYNTEIGEHSITAMIGGELFETYKFGFWAEGSGAPTDDFGDLGLTSIGEGRRGMDSWHERERIASAMGRLSYNYSSKYLLDFVARYDGYSKLSEANRFGFFPGISGGWAFGREDFMQSINHIVSFAKLRTSYGINGNVSGIKKPYDLQGIYGTGKYDGNVSYGLSAIPNPYLRWEKSYTFDIGLDVSFLQNAITLDITYYNRRTKDKHADIPLSASSGVGSIKTNNGELQNSGIEIAASFKAIDKGDWLWNIDVNAAHNKNKVISLPDNGLEYNRQNGVQIYNSNGDLTWVGGYQEGQTPGDMVAFEYAGVYQTINDIPNGLIVESVKSFSATSKKSYSPDLWAQMSDSEKANGLPILPGDAIWKDINGDNKIDQYDKVVQGNIHPKLTGGISSALTWKGLSLNIKMDFALGFVVNDYGTQHLMSFAQGDYSTVELVKETWTPENPTAKYPIVVRADQLGKANHSRPSSLYVCNSSYLAFREIGLNYQLPSNLANKVKMQSVGLMATVRNLGYITSKDGSNLYNPEYQRRDDDAGGYALPLTCTFGLNLTF